MAIAFDAVTYSGTKFTAGVTLAHTPVGTPRGVLVLITQVLTTGDEITGVTYGGAALTEVTGSPLVQAAAGGSVTYGFFLGSSVPSGAQDCVISGPGSATKHASVVTFTASSDTAIQATATYAPATTVSTINETLALSSTSAYVMLSGVSGENLATSVTPLSGWGTNVNAVKDEGAEQQVFYSYDTVGTADVTYGWVQTADYAAILAVAIKESAASGVTGTGTLTTGTTTASGTGSLAHTGTGSLTTAVTTATGTGTLAHTGTGAATVGAATITGSGTVGTAITGTGALTVGAATASGAGVISHTGTGAATVGNVTASGTGTLAHTGTGAVMIGPATSDGTGSILGQITGSGALTIQSATASGTGTLAHTGTGTLATNVVTLYGADGMLLLPVLSRARSIYSNTQTATRSNTQTATRSNTQTARRPRA